MNNKQTIKQKRVIDNLMSGNSNTERDIIKEASNGSSFIFFRNTMPV